MFYGLKLDFDELLFDSFMISRVIWSIYLFSFTPEKLKILHCIPIIKYRCKEAWIIKSILVHCASNYLPLSHFCCYKLDLIQITFIYNFCLLYQIHFFAHKERINKKYLITGMKICSKKVVKSLINWQINRSNKSDSFSTSENFACGQKKTK